MQAQSITAKAMGPGNKTVISLDMGLYQPAKKLQMARNDLNHIILSPGELHVVMAQLRTIGSFIENSGIDLCWSEALQRWSKYSMVITLRGANKLTHLPCRPFFYPLSESFLFWTRSRDCQGNWRMRKAAWRGMWYGLQGRSCKSQCQNARSIGVSRCDRENEDLRRR